MIKSCTVAQRYVTNENKLNTDRLIYIATSRYKQTTTMVSDGTKQTDENDKIGGN